MEQSLIEKYLAGETSAQEERLLRQELQAKSFATRTKEEEALLAYLNELKEKDELQDSDLDTLLGLLGDALKAVPYEEKALPVVRDEVNTTETAAVRLYEDLPEVPYMSVTDFYNRFYLAGTDLSEGMSFTRDGGVYTLTNFCGDKAVFDVNNDTVVIDNVERFIKTAHNHLITESDGYDPEASNRRRRRRRPSPWQTMTSICAATTPASTRRCPPWPTSLQAGRGTISAM